MDKHLSDRSIGCRFQLFRFFRDIVSLCFTFESMPEYKWNISHEIHEQFLAWIPAQNLKSRPNILTKTSTSSTEKEIFSSLVSEMYIYLSRWSWCLTYRKHGPSRTWNLSSNSRKRGRQYLKNNMKLLGSLDMYTSTSTGFKPHWGCFPCFAKRLPIPDAPWDWNIYPAIYPQFKPNVGKCFHTLSIWESYLRILSANLQSLGLFRAGVCLPADSWFMKTHRLRRLEMWTWPQCLGRSRETSR